MAQARLLQWAQKKKTYLHMPIKGKKIGKKFRKQGVLREIHTKIKISLCSHCINDYKGRWSEWRDSNSRHPGPKPGALPTGPHPDIELRENARCGQICGQGNSTTVLPNFQRKQSGVFAKIKGSIQHLERSNRFGVPAPKVSAIPYYSKLKGLGLL